MAIVLFYPLEGFKNSFDSSASEGETDIISWLLHYVGYENYKIDIVDPQDKYPNYLGWNITFKDQDSAMLFKLRWM